MRPPSKSPTLVAIASPPIASYELDPPLFFDAQADGLQLLARAPSSRNNARPSRIVGFLRTPEGRGFAVAREDSVEAWHLHPAAARFGNEPKTELTRLGTWPDADLVAVLDHGRRLAVYDKSESTLSLLDSSSSSPAATATCEVPPLVSLFTLPPAHSSSSSSVIGITRDAGIVHVRITPLACSPARMSVSISALPNQESGTEGDETILPVDPMAWSDGSSGQSSHRDHDVLLRIGGDGELAFWKLGGATLSASPSSSSVGKAKGKSVESEKPFEGDVDVKGESWICTGRVQTGRMGHRMARCSCAKKTALGKFAMR